MSHISSQLRTDALGAHTVVGFTGFSIPGDSFILDHRDELNRIVEEYNPQVVTFDLSNIPGISSASIGVLFGFFKRGIRVQLYKPSEATRDVMEVTQLRSVFPEVDTLPGRDTLKA